MPVTYSGGARGNAVELPRLRLPDRSRVLIVVPDETEVADDIRWAALAAKTWAQDWADKDLHLPGEARLMAHQRGRALAARNGAVVTVTELSEYYGPGPGGGTPGAASGSGDRP